MATKPAAGRERRPADSADGWLEVVRTRGDVRATASHASLLRDGEAPRAEPEEDIDDPLAGAQDRANRAPSRTETSDATASENQESARISRCIPRKTRAMVTELVEESRAQEEKSVDSLEDAFPPPPLRASSKEEGFEKESLSSLEGEVAEVMSDPTEALPSPDSQNSQEWPPLLSEPVNREETEENGTQLNFSRDGFDYSKAENKMSAAAAAGSNSTARDSAFDNSDVYAVCSPPFADESEEEEEVSMDVVSGPHQWTTLYIRGKPLHPSRSADISVSTEEDPPASSSAGQQEEPFPRSRSELSPRGGNRDAAQQVLSRSASPLSTVATEPPNQGGAGSGCAVAARERHSRAGETPEGGSKQKGGEGGQTESGLEGNKAEGLQHDGGLVKYSCKYARMESDSCDDSQSDSGVSADFSPCSTLEGGGAISPAAVPKETPIDREIRRAMEREHSLRRSRGLPNPPTSPEYVEIPLRKTVVCQSATAESERSQGKDRRLAGKKMEHEIHGETQREQDLVRLGTVPGSYDKGTVRQVKERKQLFEAFQKPSDSTLTVPVPSRATSWSSASDASTLEDQEDVSSQASTIGDSYVGRLPTQSPGTARGGGASARTTRGPGFPEGTTCQVVILESNLSVPAQKLCHAKPEAETVTVVDSGRPDVPSSRTGGHSGIKTTEDEEAPKENMFFKLRPSTKVIKVEQDIREAQEREKELHKQRVSVYGGGRGGRGGGGRPVPTLSPSPSLNGLAVPDLPDSSCRAGTRPTAVRQSVGRVGIWPPVQAEELRIDRPENPRTPRQKSPLVQRWESGLFNGHALDED